MENAEVYWIDLSSKTWDVEQLDEDTVYKWLGGRGFGLKTLRDDPDAVVIARGVLSSVPGIPGRATAYYISPKTGNIFYSSAGGNVQKMRPFAVVLEGRSEEKVFLHVTGDGVTFHDAGSFFDANVRETFQLLEERYPGRVVLATGAFDSENAVLANNRHAFFGRGGLGNVLRSRGVKALVIDPLSGSSAPITPEYMDVLRGLLAKLKQNSVVAQLTKSGTVGMLLHELGRRGRLPVGLDWERVLSAWQAFEKKGHPCAGCPIACKKDFEFWGGFLTFYRDAGTDFHSIAKMYERLNDAGIDAVAFPVMVSPDDPVYSLAVETNVRRDQNQLILTKMWREDLEDVDDPVGYVISVQDEIAVVDSAVTCGFSLYAWDLDDYSALLGSLGIELSSEELREIGGRIWREELRLARERGLELHEKNAHVREYLRRRGLL